MWDNNIVIGNQQRIPMENLLNNLIHIRGIDMGNSAHDFCQRAFEIPIGSSKSLSAIAADISQTFFGSINLGGTNQFRSLKSKTSIAISQKEEIIEKLLLPFKLSSQAKQILERSKKMSSTHQEFTKMIGEEGEQLSLIHI